MGSSVTVTGQGFTPFGYLPTLTLGGVSVLPGQGYIAPNGSFTYFFTVPPTAPAGPSVVSARDNAGRSATATLTVVRAAAPPPSPTPTRVPPTPTPTQTPSSATIGSASCTFLSKGKDSNFRDIYTFEVRASGTASGPVGAVLEAPYWYGGKNSTVTVSSWTYLRARFAERMAGQPYTTTYSARFTFDLDGPSFADNLGVSVSGPNAIVVFKHLTCRQ